MSAVELNGYLDAVVRMINPRGSKRGGDIKSERYISKRFKKPEAE